MSTLRRHCAVAACTLAFTAASLVAAAPVSAESAGSAQTTLTALRCVIRDGTSKLGSRTGSSPVRYEYPDSPYVGLRWNSCTDKVVIHYGGYSPELIGEFYQLRRTETGSQVELPNGERRTRTINAPDAAAMTYIAQYCHRPAIGSVRCGRWSPPVTLRLR
jgi:hypothetical protein